MCQPIFPMPARNAAALRCRRRIFCCARGRPRRLPNTQSCRPVCKLLFRSSCKGPARPRCTGRGLREASVFVSPTLPFTTPRRIRTVRSSQLKSPHCRPMISLARRPRQAATRTMVRYGSASCSSRRRISSEVSTRGICLGTLLTSDFNRPRGSHPTCAPRVSSGVQFCKRLATRG